MKHPLSVGLLVVALGGAALTVHAQDTLPPWFQQFVNEVTAALQELQALVAQNASDIARHEDALGNLGARVYDFHDYTLPRGVLPRIQTRTFQLSGPGTCGSTETSRVSGTLEADGSVLVREYRQWRAPSGALCADFVLETRLTDGDLSIVGLEIPFFGVKSTRDVGVPLVTSAMRIGSSWGGGSRVTQTSTATGAVLETGLATGVGTLIGVEGVTVPAGTFTGCLKTSMLFNDKFISNTSNINWWCAGHGVVRQIIVNTGNSLGYERQLVSVEFH